MGASGVVGSWFELGDGNANVVGFLEKGAAIAGLGEAPDVVWPVCEEVEVRSIGPHAGKLAVSEGDAFRAVGEGFTRWSLNFRSVEETLSERNPASGHAFELVREKV